MSAIVSNFNKQKLKKYSTCYSDLSNLILGMTAEQQSLLLNQAKQMVNPKKESILREFILNKYGILAIGFLFGWIFTSLLFLVFVLI